MTSLLLRRWKLLLPLVMLTPAAEGQLAFTEYIEGSAFNRALEIYNFSQAPIDLDAYRIEIYANGSPVPTLVIDLDDVSLGPRDVWVVAHPYIDPDVLPYVDQLSEAMTFSGNDVVALRAPGGIVDAVGEIGVDPGTHWGSEADVTQDATLRRDSYDCTSRYVGIGAYDPSATWSGVAQDDMSHLGFSPLSLSLVHCTYAAATYRNPSFWGRVNPAAYSVASLPVLSSTYTAVIDTGGMQGAYLVGYYGSNLQPSNWGNILVNYTDPPGELLGMVWGIGSPVVLEVAVPASVGLAGVTISTQAVRFGGGVDLTNAQDLRFGY